MKKQVKDDVKDYGLNQPQPVQSIPLEEMAVYLQSIDKNLDRIALVLEILLSEIQKDINKEKTDEIAPVSDSFRF